MRRTLTVLVASAALLVPATAASAAPPDGKTKQNASCNSGQQRGPAHMFPTGGLGYNGGGNEELARSYETCGGDVVRVTPPKETVEDCELDFFTGECKDDGTDF